MDCSTKVKSQLICATLSPSFNSHPFNLQDKPQESQNQTSEINTKKSEIVDPYEYVRNMGEGASMEPIRSKTASNFKNAGHSDPLILWKNSQSTSMNVLAKKKSSIPVPGEKIKILIELIA